MGLSGTWGVKAEVQLATFIIAPSADDSSMIDLAFERAGWDSSGFHGFRLGMRYPPIPTSLILGADLPEPT